MQPCFKNHHKASLHRVAREGPSEEITFEGSPEEVRKQSKPRSRKSQGEETEGLKPRGEPEAGRHSQPQSV